MGIDTGMLWLTEQVSTFIYALTGINNFQLARLSFVPAILYFVGSLLLVDKIFITELNENVRYKIFIFTNLTMIGILLFSLIKKQERKWKSSYHYKNSEKTDPTTVLLRIFCLIISAVLLVVTLINYEDILFYLYALFITITTALYFMSVEIKMDVDMITEPTRRV